MPSTARKACLRTVVGAWVVFWLRIDWVFDVALSLVATRRSFAQNARAVRDERTPTRRSERMTPPQVVRWHPKNRHDVQMGAV